MYSIIKTEYALVKFQKAEVFQEVQFIVGSKSREIYYREIMMKRNKRKENKVKWNFNVKNPNEIWASDVTYFKVKGKRYYICVVLDLFSRKIKGMEVSKRNSIWLKKQL